MVYTVGSFFAQNTILIKIDKVKKKLKNPLNYIVSQYLKQALAVHLQHHVIHATCQIISGSDLISIFELIQNITASFTIQEKEKHSLLCRYR